MTLESKKVIISGEEREVWPHYCQRPTQNCGQCDIEGKLLCAPRFRVDKSEKPPQPPPPPPKPYKRAEQEAYYETNKEAIVSDYYSMRTLGFFHRWHITPQTWIWLKTKWNVVGKRSPRVQEKKEEDSPPLPAFDATWTEAVQVEWLKTYRILKARKKI